MPCYYKILTFYSWFYST